MMFYVFQEEKQIGMKGSTGCDCCKLMGEMKAEPAMTNAPVLSLYTLLRNCACRTLKRYKVRKWRLSCRKTVTFL